MNLDIALVVDNQADAELMTEHGLSMWIRYAGQKILFDTGQGTALAANALHMGIPLEMIETVVLSHGHYDHTGGLSHVLQQNDAVELYCHPGVVQPRYSIRRSNARDIHMPRHAMAALDRLPPHRLHWVSQPVHITQDIGLTGPVPRNSRFEDNHGPFYLDPGARRVDPIEDDMAMWLHTPQGMVVCVGCAHAGLINTLDYICKLNDTNTIRAIIGGFHLLDADLERITQTVSELAKFRPEIVVACHCTGDSAMTYLKDAFGDRFKIGQAGMRFLF